VVGGGDAAHAHIAHVCWGTGSGKKSSSGHVSFSFLTLSFALCLFVVLAPATVGWHLLEIRIHVECSL
jgi:hypothetical protein